MVFKMDLEIELQRKENISHNLKNENSKRIIISVILMKNNKKM